MIIHQRFIFRQERTMHRWMIMICPSWPNRLEIPQHKINRQRPSRSTRTATSISRLGEKFIAWTLGIRRIP